MSRESNLVLRAARRAAQRCILCTAPTAAPAHAHCDGCLDYKRDRQRARRALQPGELGERRPYHCRACGGRGHQIITCADRREGARP